MKKLRRIKSESMLGGVAAGLAEYFDIDVTIIRIILAIGIFAPFPVVIPYVVMWIVMPAVEPALSGGSRTESTDLAIVNS